MTLHDLLTESERVDIRVNPYLESKAVFHDGFLSVAQPIYDKLTVLKGDELAEYCKTVEFINIGNTVYQKFPPLKW